MTKAEQAIARNLRIILEPLPVGAPIEQSDEFRTVLSALEFYIPAVLREIHHEWKHESLDGVFPTFSGKMGANQALIAGTCILISDQKFTPIHLQLRVSESNDEVVWMECRLGQKENGKLKRLPYDRMHGWSDRLLLAAAEDVNAIDWYYSVGFGERRL